MPLLDHFRGRAQCWGLVAWCWGFSLLHAQERTLIRGTVRAADSHAALPGCQIVVSGTAYGAASDAHGNFAIAGVPFGRVQLLASCLGYASQRLNLELAQREVQVELFLQPQALSAPPVMVLASRANARESATTFSTLTAHDLQQRYFTQDIPVMLSELPATTFYSENGNGMGYNYLSIRGFDQRRISVLINGVPQNDPEDHNVYWIDFPDLLGNTEDIQVQRGAGSAFYGPPAIGGAVNILTSNFSPRPSLTAFAGAGTYATRKYSLALHSGWLARKFLFMGRFSHLQSDGYRERSWVDLKSYFLGAAHVSGKSSTRLHFYGGPIRDGLAYKGVPKLFNTDQDLRRKNYSAWSVQGDSLTYFTARRPDEIENFNQPQLQLINEYRWRDDLRISNTLFAIRGYGFFDYDGSWAPLSYYRLTPEYGFAVAGNPEEIFVDSLLIRAYVENKQIGWLPQLTWQHAAGEVTLGAELRRHRSLHWGRIQQGDEALPPAVSGDYEGHNYIGVRRYYEYRGACEVISPYAHAAFALRHNLRLNFDLQFVNLNYRLYDEEFIGTDFTLHYHFWNPRLGVHYNINEKLHAYASAARTSREPRLKNFYDAAEASTPASWGAVTPQFEQLPEGSYDFTRPLVQPEKLYDYEIGAGYRQEQWRVTLNYFYMNFQDEIIKSGQLDRLGQPVTGNADRTLHQGLEFETEIRPSSRFTVSGNFMLSQNELKEYAVFLDSSNAVSLNGNPVAGFPNFLANARLTYTQGGFAATLALQHVGKKYTDNYGEHAAEIAETPRDNTVEAYTVWHGALQYAFAQGGLRGLKVQLHAQNLGDQLYLLHGEGDDFFPAAERQFFVNVKYER